MDKLAEHIGVSTNHVDPNETSIREELNTYKNFLSNKQDMKTIWGLETKLVKLKEVAKSVYISPASSVASESAFSTANYLMRKERMSLHPETLRAQLILAEEDKIDKIL